MDGALHGRRHESSPPLCQEGLIILPYREEAINSPGGFLRRVAEPGLEAWLSMAVLASHYWDELLLHYTRKVIRHGIWG